MSERIQAGLLQLIGFVAVLIAIGGALFASTKFPALGLPLTALGTAFVSLVSWYTGKLLALPLPSVTLHAVDSMPIEHTAAIVSRILSNAPPQRIAAIISSIPPAARQQLIDISGNNHDEVDTPPV